VAQGELLALGFLEVGADHLATSSAKRTLVFQPSLRRALAASPSRLSTSVGRNTWVDRDDAAPS